MRNPPDTAPHSNKPHWIVYVSVLIGIAGLIIAFLAWRNPVSPAPGHASVSKSHADVGPDLASMNSDNKTQPAQAQLEESNGLANPQAAELPKPIEPEATQRRLQAPEKAADDLKAYRIRYVGEHNARHSIAVMIADENGQPNQSFGQSLCTLLATNGLTTTASLFTPDFIADGLLSQMLSGSKEVFDRLQLANTVQAVLLARQSVEYSTNSALDNLITATMTFDVSGFATSGFQMVFADSIKAAGAGLTRLEARTTAEERVLKQLQDGRLGQIQKELLVGAE